MFQNPVIVRILADACQCRMRRRKEKDQANGEHPLSVKTAILGLLFMIYLVKKISILHTSKILRLSENCESEKNAASIRLIHKLVPERQDSGIVQSGLKSCQILAEYI